MGKSAQITICNEERKVYLDIRAEQIKHFQDTRNGHLFINPYSIEKAREIAENQLNCDLQNGKLRISIQELLLDDNETCIETTRSGLIELAKKLK